MAANEKLTVDRKSEHARKTGRCFWLLRTPGFPTKTFIYKKDTQNRAIVELKKTIYEYIYVYLKVGKNKCFNQKNIPFLVLKMYF